MALFKPDAIRASVADIDLDSLWDAGIRCMLVDMDNTLLSRETGEISPETQEWLDAAARRGMAVCLVSNNWHASVMDEAAALGLPIIHKAMKPFPLAYAVARRRMGFTRRESVGVGDQLMTDVIGSHLSGMRAILVLPLAQKDLPHTLALRRVERVLMGGETVPFEPWEGLGGVPRDPGMEGDAARCQHRSPCP